MPIIAVATLHESEGIVALLTAISLFVYFLAEPFRQVSANDAFLERSIERGATLFANKQSTAYEAEFSLLCADCHGVDGKGGTAPYVLQPEADKCLIEKNKNNPSVPECLPKSVGWDAPNLTLAGLRYTRAQIFQIVTYGRPGTPMQRGVSPAARAQRTCRASTTS